MVASLVTIGFRRFTARRKGLVPADIVYYYDAAHLLHSFIARARCPIFCDAVEQDGLQDLYGRLVVHWPKPHMRSIRPANDSAITVVHKGSESIALSVPTRP